MLHSLEAKECEGSKGEQQKCPPKAKLVPMTAFGRFFEFSHKVNRAQQTATTNPAELAASLDVAPPPSSEHTSLLSRAGPPVGTQKMCWLLVPCSYLLFVCPSGISKYSVGCLVVPLSSRSSPSQASSGMPGFTSIFVFCLPIC